MPIEGLTDDFCKLLEEMGQRAVKDRCIGITLGTEMLLIAMHDGADRWRLWEMAFRSGTIREPSPSLRWLDQAYQASVIAFAAALSGDGVRFGRYATAAREAFRAGG